MNIKPFKAIYFNPQKVNPSEVATQPYDKIDSNLQEIYYRRNNFNIVRIILGKKFATDNSEDNVYTRAKKYFDDWLENNILVKDTSACIYPYYQYFKDNLGVARIRKGFISLLQIEKFGEGIKPHEQTFSGPIQDRLRLLRETQANFELIFILYDDPQNKIIKILDEVVKSPTFLEVDDDFGNKHKVWRLEDINAIQMVSSHFKEFKCIIADGHHRYKTSLLYKEEMESKGSLLIDAPYNYIMAAFFNLYDEGLVILPTHRAVVKPSHFTGDEIIGALQKNFVVSEIKINSFSDEEINKRLMETEGKANYIWYNKKLNKWYLLRLREDVNLDSAVNVEHSLEWKGINTVILHWLLLKPIYNILPEKPRAEEEVYYFRYIKDIEYLLKEREDISLFFVKPLGIDELRTIVQKNETFPQKTTDFYPKVLSGLLIYSFELS